MKYCRNCGNEVYDNAVICPKCGCSVDYGSDSQYHTRAPANKEDYTVLSILGFIFAFVESIVGLILSIIAYNDAKKTGNLKSLNFSKAGIIISSVFLGISVFVVIIWYIVFFMTLSIGGFYYM